MSDDTNLPDGATPEEPPTGAASGRPEPENASAASLPPDTAEAVVDNAASQATPSAAESRSASSGSGSAPVGRTYEPQREQRANRAENADFMRVLQLFGQMPQAYTEAIHAAGDVVFNIDQSASTRTTPPMRDSGEVAPEEIRLIRGVFQRPSMYGQAWMALQERRCVVLHGRPQVGKRAAAIRLALDLKENRPAVTIRELSPEDDLVEQLPVDQIRPDTVYLVDGLLREAARPLKPHSARKLASDLAARNSYLLVCARPDVSLPGDWQAVTLEPPTVSPEILVSAHLDFYGPFDEERVKEALAFPAIQELLKKGLLPCQAEQLARQISQALRDGTPLETALLGFAAAAEGEVERWFEEAQDDLEEWTFRIALAVFNGARYVSVIEAGRGLARLLERPESTEDDKKQAEPGPVEPSPFLKKRSGRLTRARARLTSRLISAEYSDRASMEVVELEDPGFSPALLKYLWTELDNLREPLLQWLRTHAVEGNHDMRLRAAGALGALAGLDANAFEFMRGAVFRPWAFEGKDKPDLRRRHHQALGAAFGVLIWNEQRAEDVLGLLQDWAGSESQPALQWAAARAYAQVGLRYPGKAIAQWRQILNSAKDRFVLRLTDTLGISLPDLPLQMSVVDAIVSLFLRAAEMPHRLKPVYEQALESLAAWVEADAQDRKAMQAGLPLFLALTPVRLPPEDGSGELEEWPAAMLYIIGSQPESAYRRALASMLRHALNHPNHGPTALEALRAWAASADRDQWLERTLTLLLRELWTLPGITPRERQRLKFHLTRWHQHPKRPLAVAGRILSNLDSPSLLEKPHGA